MTFLSRLIRAAAPIVALALAVPGSARAAGCADLPSGAHLPAWAAQDQAAVIGDSVLSGSGGAYKGFGAAMPHCHFVDLGKPGLDIRDAEQRLRQAGRPVPPLMIIGLGYIAEFQRDRVRYAYWAHRFDTDAVRLVTTLKRLGAKKIVWLTLHRPTESNTPRRARYEIDAYAWFFGYVNERLRVLDRRHDVSLADWAHDSRRSGLMVDFIHVNASGARAMGQTVKRAIRTAAGK